MKYLFIYLSFILLSFQVSAQNIQGRIIYEGIVDDTELLEKINDPEKSAEIRNMISQSLQFLKSVIEKTYTLEFSNGESIYSEQGSLDITEKSEISLPKGTLYKNLKTNLTLKQSEYSGNRYLIKDTIKTFDWELTNETKNIDKFICYKAFLCWNDTTTARKTNLDGSVVPVQVIDENLVAAWYTTEIPIGFGPRKYGGLPGLILEMDFKGSDVRNKLIATEISINPKKQIKIKKPSRGIVVHGQKGFDEAMKKIFEENRK